MTTFSRPHSSKFCRRRLGVFSLLFLAPTIFASQLPLPLLLNTCNGTSVAWKQVFSTTAVPSAISLITPSAYSETICLTTSNTTVGAAVQSYACQSPLLATQTFSIDSQGHLLLNYQNTNYVIDPSYNQNITNPLYYIGSPLYFNTLTTATSGSIFTLNTTGYPAGTGTLVHKDSQLCLDAGPLPNGHGCLDPAVRSLPFCNPDLLVDDRVADLISRLTLAEKIGLTGSGNWNDGRSSCDTIDPGVERLSIPPTEWLVETNSMVASQCYAGQTCATLFPSAQNLAATFNRSVWVLKGIVMSDEMRALNNLGWHRADTTANTMIGLNGYGPDINNPRDPRNGRQGELPTEDPFLSGCYAAAYVNAFQGQDPNYYKATAGLKHYTGYSLETGRFSSKGNFSIYDLFDTYLVPFEMAFTDALASGSMCSYISLGIPDGPPYVPSCGNEWLLNTLVREYWGITGAIHISDCGAVQNMAPNGYTKNDTQSAAVALNAGLNLNSNTILPNNLAMAIALNLTNETMLDKAISQTLTVRIRSGMLDPLEYNPWYSYGIERVGTPDNLNIAMEGAIQGLALIKNNNNALPIKRGQSIAVLGPLANAQEALTGDYYADSVCPGRTDWDKSSFDCIPTIAQSIINLNTGGTVMNYSGVSISGNDTTWGAALQSASTADVIVLCLGTDQTIAHEGTDRNDIGLPGIQADFALAVRAAAGAKTPIIFVMISSFPTSYDPIVNSVDAIVIGYTPSFGAPAIASALFGTNRWGRASMSIYPYAYQNAVSIYDFSMVPTPTNPGRTYRYYNGSVGDLLVRFGEGLTYNTLNLVCSGGYSPNSDYQLIDIDCSITSLTGPDGDQILQIYHRVSNDIINRINNSHPIPLTKLVEFERYAVPAGSTLNVTITVYTEQVLSLIDESGATVLYPGLHYLDVWDGSNNNVTVSIETPTNKKRIITQPPLPSY